MRPVVTALTCYPVKGCAGVPLDAAELTPAGLAHDRELMAVGPDGVFRSQRTAPRMATIRPEVLEGGAALRLRAPGADPLVVRAVDDGARQVVSVHVWQGKGIDQGDAAADWLSRVLGEPTRLMRVPPEHDRVTSGETAGTAGFADAHALLVISESSLDLLNERIAAAGGEPVGMDRFRPNIVVGGWEAPHTEDEVRAARVGGARMAFAKLCVRCAVPLVDQQTGERAGPEPIRTLAGYRRDADGGVVFGMKAAVLAPGPLRVGDRFHTEQWRRGSAGGSAGTSAG